MSEKSSYDDRRNSTRFQLNLPAQMNGDGYHNIEMIDISSSGMQIKTGQGPYSFVVNLQGLCNNMSTLTHSGTLTMVLSQSGTSFSGSGTVTGIKVLGFNGFGGCFVASTQTFGGSVSGTLSGQSVTGQINFSNLDLGVISFSGTLSGNSISNGTLSSPDGSGTFSATKQ